MKADEIQIAPRFEPADRENEAVQQRVIRKQHDVIAFAAAGEHRRQERAGEPEHREHLGILPDREQRRRDAEHHEEREARRRMDQREHAQREEHVEIQQADARALQNQAVQPARRAQPPAAHTACRNPPPRPPSEPQRHRQHVVVVGELEQEADAEKQNHHADLGDDVAGEQTLPPRRARPRSNGAADGAVVARTALPAAAAAGIAAPRPLVTCATTAAAARLLQRDRRLDAECSVRVGYGTGAVTSQPRAGGIA